MSVRLLWLVEGGEEHRWKDPESASGFRNGSHRWRNARSMQNDGLAVENLNSGPSNHFLCVSWMIYFDSLVDLH